MNLNTMILPPTLPDMLCRGLVCQFWYVPPGDQMHRKWSCVVTQVWKRGVVDVLVDVCLEKSMHAETGVIAESKYQPMHDPRRIALDLTNELTRTHAALWAVTTGAVAERCAILWLLPQAPRAACWAHLKREGSFLSYLDVDDPRRLPDGSCWVDAEALRLLCLHIALKRYPNYLAVAEWRAALEAK